MPDGDASQMQNGTTCRVLYAFNSADEDVELSVAKGDLVTIIGAPIDNWIMVQMKADPKKKGFVPSDYLQATEEPPAAPAPAKPSGTAAAATKGPDMDFLDNLDFAPQPTPAAGNAPAFPSEDLFGAAGGPSADPFAATPSADPFAAAPSADPFTAAPSADPFTAAPSADPFAAAPSADPFAAAPSSGPRADFAFPAPAAPAGPGDLFAATSAAPAFGNSGAFGAAPPPPDFGAPAFAAPSPDASAASLFPAGAAAPFGAEAAGSLAGPPPLEAAPMGGPDAPPQLPPLQAFARHEMYFKRLMAERTDTLKQLEAVLAKHQQQINGVKEKNLAVTQKIKELDGLVDTERQQWRERVAEQQRILQGRPALA